MDYQFTITGLDELEAAMRGLDDALARHIQGAGLIAMARVVVKEAKARVPVETGALQRSIRARKAGERFRGRKIPGGAANVFAGGPGARHAHLIELGTVKAPAYPFLSSALLATKSQQQDALVSGTSRELERQVRRLATGTQSRAITRLVTAE